MHTELVKAKALTKIPVSEKRPSEGGEIRYLTPEEFNDKFNCEYTESVWGNSAIEENITAEDLNSILDPTIYKPDVVDILYRLEHPFTGFVITKINELVGYGVVATELIPAGTVLCLYAGQAGQGGSLYAADWLRGTSIDAAHRGGLARFFMHLPDDPIAENENLKALIQKKQLSTEIKIYYGKNELSNYDFVNAEVRTNLLTRNVIAVPQLVGKLPIMIIISLRDIQSGEWIGISYGERYWCKLSLTPRYFSKTGVMIDNRLYQAKPVYKIDLNVRFIWSRCLDPSGWYAVNLWNRDPTKVIMFKLTHFLENIRKEELKMGSVVRLFSSNMETASDNELKEAVEKRDEIVVVNSKENFDFFFLESFGKKIGHFVIFKNNLDQVETLDLLSECSFDGEILERTEKNNRLFKSIYKLVSLNFGVTQEPNISQIFSYKIQAACGYFKLNKFDECDNLFSSLLNQETLAELAKKDQDELFDLYQTVLKDMKFNFRKIYDDAVNVYKKGNHAFAREKLLFLLKMPRLTEEMQSFCHSTLLSCYRDLGCINEAISHGQQALAIRQRLHGEQAPEVTKIKEKLTLLLN